MELVAPSVAAGHAPPMGRAATVSAVRIGLGALHRFGPDREPARWRWTSWGAVGATLVWLATSAALFAYVRTAGLHDVTCGSLAGVAISMLWVWPTVLLVLVADDAPPRSGDAHR